MNLLIDQIIDGNISDKKLKRLSKQDKKTILSIMFHKFKIETKKSNKVRFMFIIMKLRRMFNQ